MMKGAMLMGHIGPALMIFRVLGVILIIIAVILLIKHNKKKTLNVSEAESNPAIETVKMLYAQGTIDEAEYSKRLAVLNGNVYIDNKKDDDTTQVK